MDGIMSWTEKTKFDVTAAERLVRRSVQARRNLGLKQDHAMQDAALALGATPRRVRGFIRGEVFRVARREYERLLRLWWKDMDSQAAELIAAGVRLQKAGEAEWLSVNQYTLNLEAPCSAPLPRNSVSGDGGARSGVGKRNRLARGAVDTVG